MRQYYSIPWNIVLLFIIYHGTMIEGLLPTKITRASSKRCSLLSNRQYMAVSTADAKEKVWEDSFNSTDFTCSIILEMEDEIVVKEDILSRTIPSRPPMSSGKTIAKPDIHPHKIPPRPPMSPGKTIAKPELTSTTLLKDDYSGHYLNSNTPQVLVKKKNVIVMEQLKQQVDVAGFGGATGELVESIFGKTVKQRLWTKADFAHIHAVSGAIYLAFGIPWILYTTFHHLMAIDDGQAALSEDLSSPFLTFLLFQGAVNALSAIPMARFSSNKIFDFSDLKGLGFSVGGTGLTLMCVWASLWFSGGYPESLHGLPDTMFLTFWSIICIATTFNWETMLQQNFEATNGEGKASMKTMTEIRKAGNKKLAEKAGDPGNLNMFEKQILYRLASWPNLTQILFLANPCIGGMAWMSQVNTQYPLQQMLCYHYAFASGLGYALSMFSETLRDRKLVTLRQDLIILLIGTIFPMLIVWLDLVAFGDKVVVNPFDYWYIFK